MNIVTEDDFELAAIMPICSINPKQYHVCHFIIPRFKEIHRIAFKIVFTNNEKENVVMPLLVKSMRLFVGAMQMDYACKVDSFEWLSDKELVIEFDFRYSNGVIILNECKYFDINAYLDLWDNYYVDKCYGVLSYVCN